MTEGMVQGEEIVTYCRRRDRGGSTEHLVCERRLNRLCRRCRRLLRLLLSQMLAGDGQYGNVVCVREKTCLPLAADVVGLVCQDEWDVAVASWLC